MTCGAPLKRKRVGRQRQYCRDRCRDEARRARNFGVSCGTRPRHKQSHKTLKITQQKQEPAKAVLVVEVPLEIVGNGYRWPRPQRPDPRRLIRNAIAAELSDYVLRRARGDGEST
jgi:hypothetical protein